MNFLYFPIPFTKIKVSIVAILVIFAMFYADASFFTLEVLMSAVIHEAGHLVAMKIFGVNIYSVSVLPCGAVIHSDTSLLPYKKEAAVALSGAFANIVTGFVALIIYVCFHDIYSLFFVVSSFFLAFVNLVPAKSLDGARALEAYLCTRFDCDRAERILAVVSGISFAVLVAVSLFLLWITGGNFSLLVFCVYLFICAYVQN